MLFTVVYKVSRFEINGGWGRISECRELYTPPFVQVQHSLCVGVHDGGAPVVRRRVPPQAGISAQAFSFNPFSENLEVSGRKNIILKNFVMDILIDKKKGGKGLRIFLFLNIYIFLQGASAGQQD